MKSITVCLSTYNGEIYLKPLLDSVLNQQEVELFLYVRDDGSTDSTRSILKEYDKTHANMHITEGKNIGYVQSFWSLLSEADQSDYYAFCDQDDIWQPNKCIEAIKRIETQPGSSPVLYTSNVKGINEKGEIISEEVFPLHRVLSFAECLQRGSLPGCTFIFNEALRKQAVKYNGPQISHDWTLYIIAKATGTVLY
ncbi:MAG: glycosyltransferase, partial [Erysipelotrichaceae bacterium]|nr:glycosyltransferase [Erysipelotrichaceae bacterium]